MTEQNSIYKPVRLNVGIDGQGDCKVMNGLANDLIMQNICVICRDKPFTIEEIARTLGISTFYLEEKIESLLYMDFIKQVGNRYQTTFFIEDEKYQLEKLKFSYENTMRILFETFITLLKICTGNNVEQSFNRPLSPIMRAESRRLDRYIEQQNFLCNHTLTSFLMRIFLICWSRKENDVMKKHPVSESFGFI